jgi:hypothetical protein
MSAPNEVEHQPFFLVVNIDTGEIYCAHQEYSANDRRLQMKSSNDESILAIAMKANPSCRYAGDKLKVVPVMCPPTINFSRYKFDMHKMSLVERQRKELVAAFPLSYTQLVLVCPEPVHPSMTELSLYRLQSGLAVKDVQVDPERPDQLILQVEAMKTLPLTIDAVTIRNLQTADGRSLGEFISPRFIQGIQTPMELKIPNFEANFPYPSTLVGLHVSVMCCTGCNGGVHDRNLVVINHHVGGSWSGIWVRTEKTIETPYPRWQRVLFAGGVVAEEDGSTLVIDQGWMRVEKGDEPPHHAPPPLPIETIDLPAEHTPSLLAKSLDGTWVQFDDITIESVNQVEATEGKTKTVNLPRTEIVFRDKSGGRSIAWLYQPFGLNVQPGQTLKRLRGFVHAEEPGLYLLLSDKEEDITI